MRADQFYIVFFGHSTYFLFLMTLSMLLLYSSIRTIALSGYLDPLHFYWTFTFGTSYGIIIGLYGLGLISNFLFWTVIGYGVLFAFFINFFSRVKVKEIERVLRSFVSPPGDGNTQFAAICILYAALLVLLAVEVGFGISADTNRFEQNRGFGIFVRLADALRIFIIAYLTGYYIKVGRRSSYRSVRALFLLLSVVFVILLSSVVNGAKFAALEGMYGVFVAVAIYAKKPKLKFIYTCSAFLIAAIFAMAALSINLHKTGVDLESKPVYMPGGSVLVERLVLRIIGNADKYYLTLPNNVIDELKTDNVVVRYFAPIIGSTRLSQIMGYDVNEYSVGRQALLHYDPNYKIAGGPTSHFDLFAYKYWTPYFGWIWVMLTAFILSLIASLVKGCKGDIYMTAIVAALWVRALPILLEPTVGLAYILDILVIFTSVKLISLLLKAPEKSSVEHA